ncbi:MAG: Uma2 family endonuclease [Candidatus Eremiobacterota bacterium]
MDTSIRYTGEDLLAMPEQDRFELVRGELVAMPPPPGGKHGLLTGQVYRILDRYASDRNLGWVLLECGFYLSRDPDTVRAPDVMYYARDRLPEVPEGYLECPPDLAVEIASPSQSSTYLEEKVQDYLSAGVRLVWVLYPRTRTVHGYFPGGRAQVLYASDVLTGEDVLPGFSLPVSQLFLDGPG